MASQETATRIKVTVAGGNGMIGSAVQQTLCECQRYDVQVLMRRDAPFVPHRLAKAVEYDNEVDPTLEVAFEGQDVFISALGKVALQHQPKLIETAIKAGVKRIIPSEFGSDLQHPLVRTMPNYKLKIAVEELLQQQAAETGVTYTFIYTNCLLDWALSPSGALVLDPIARHMKLYDGGEQPFSATTVTAAAEAVLCVLENLNATVNRAVRVHSTALTQREILEMAQISTIDDGGRAWTTEFVDTEKLEMEAREAFETEPVPPAMFFHFAARAAFAKGYGGHFVTNDNALLGLPELSKADVETLVREAVARSK